MRKLGFVLLALVLGLGALGIGYASWSQNLSIDGTVNTGTFLATIDVNPPGLISPVDYATITEGSSTSTSLIINIENAAPGNVFTANFAVTNDGSIPANISFAAPVVSATGTGATAGDITVGNLPEPADIEGGVALPGSLTITVNDSTPSTGAAYTIVLDIVASPP